jgi:hypothetical protein
VHRPLPDTLEVLAASSVNCGLYSGTGVWSFWLLPGLKSQCRGTALSSRSLVLTFVPCFPGYPALLLLPKVGGGRMETVSHLVTTDLVAHSMSMGPSIGEVGFCSALAFTLA